MGRRFKLIRLIDVGGMAAVYEASHRNGKRVAVKVLHPRLGVWERQRKRFLREAYIANAVHHPGVVPVYDDGLDGDDAYLVMELLQGETAAALQKRAGGTLPPERVCQIGDALLDVLVAAHACGVVHRDIKPGNLFVESDGRLRVLDFGIASFEHVPGATVDTQAGAMLGTAAFMPQEQARGRWDEVDERSDVWAVGATLFTLLTGEFVHVGGTANEQLGRAMTTPPRSLASVAPEVPEALVAVIDRALQFERGERWPTAKSMQAALRAMISMPYAVSADAPVAQYPDRALTASPSTAANSSEGAQAVFAPKRRSTAVVLTFAACVSIAVTAAAYAVLSAPTRPARAQLGSSFAPTVAAVPMAINERAQGMLAELPASATPPRGPGGHAARPIAPLAEVSAKPSSLPSHAAKPRPDRTGRAPRPGAASGDPFDLRY